METVECLYDKYIKDFRCKYYMTRSTKSYIDEKDTVETYGVKIDKIDKKGFIVSSATVLNVGINKKDVKNFIKLLKDGKVTPITLEDIAIDNDIPT